MLPAEGQKADQGNKRGSHPKLHGPPEKSGNDSCVAPSTGDGRGKEQNKRSRADLNKPYIEDSQEDRGQRVPPTFRVPGSRSSRTICVSLREDGASGELAVLALDGFHPERSLYRGAPKGLSPRDLRRLRFHNFNDLP